MKDNIINKTIQFFTKEDLVEQARRIINLEINGIKQLQDSLGDNFTTVVNLIFNQKKTGSVIITGIGKSGHIGNKIASTLASTGTRAFFVHPAEALHGDLGMIRKDDIVIAISNSGNTSELNGIINYCIRFSIILIAITSNPDSDLGRSASHILLLPQAKEACSLGLAPTTSTTNTLVLGDAIAITLLEKRNFSAEDFKVFHPGGSLGTKLINIADIMHKEVPIVKEFTLMQDAIIEITSYKFGSLGIVNQQDELIGVITDGDIRRHMDVDFLTKHVQDVMTKNFISVSPDTNSSKALLIMNENKITSLFILDNKKPVGIVHLHDLINLGVL